MKKKLLTSLAVLAACAATGVGIHGWSQGQRGADVAATKAPGPSRAPSWQAGQRYVLRVALDASARLHLPEVGAGGDESVVGLEGELVLAAYGEKDGATILGAELRSLSRHRLKVLGQEALASDAEATDTLEGHEAFLAMKPDGTVASLSFRKDAPPLFKAVLQQVASTLALSVPPGAEGSWSGDEHGLFGRRATRYEAAADGALLRTVAAYTSLDALPANLFAGLAQKASGSARFELDGHGALARLDDEETVQVGTSAATSTSFEGHLTVHVETLRQEPFTAPAAVAMDPATFETIAADVRLSAEALARQGVEQVAAGMDAMTLASTLAGYAGGGRVAPGFVQRAVAFLQVHPEECVNLVALFTSPAMKGPGRLLVLDVLASTGHKEAQAALRQALASPIAHESPRAYTMMVQRLGLVARPDAESLAFLRKELDGAAAAGKDVRYGTLYALGAAAGSAQDAGDATAAATAAARVRSELRLARTEGDKGAAIVALGNAHRAEDVPRIAAYAKDEATSVRASVARALVHNDGEGARQVLVDLVGDADTEVAVTALAGLARRPSTAAEVNALASLVQSDRLPAGSESALVEFAAKQVGTGNDGALRPLLEGILPRVSNELGAKIRYLLDNLAG